MDTIVRSVPFTLTRSGEGDGLTLTGYAAVFNSPTLIRGEGPDFHEVIAPGAFARTIKARTPVLMFDHGQHPVVGSIPIGQITKLREDGRGLHVEARLFDNWLTQPVRDAIAGEAIDGMSFRFNVPKGKDDWDRSADVPLRTLREVNCAELGPVVFPAYADTSVAVRSLFNDLDSETRSQIVDAFRSLTVEDEPEIEETEQVLPEADDTRDDGLSEDPALDTEPAPDSTSEVDPPSTADSQPDGTQLPVSVAAARLQLLELQRN